MNGTKTETSRRKLRSMRFNERRIKRNFYFFELGFIFVIIPLLILSFAGPVLYYFAITRQFHLWPFFVFGIMTVFFEIIALQHFIKRYYLDPHNMTSGEFLRYLFDTKFRESKEQPTKDKGNLFWYEELDDFIIQVKITRKEKTDKIYASAYPHLEEFEYELK